MRAVFAWGAALGAHLRSEGAPEAPEEASGGGRRGGGGDDRRFQHTDVDSQFYRLIHRGAPVVSWTPPVPAYLEEARMQSEELYATTTTPPTPPPVLNVVNTLHALGDEAITKRASTDAAAASEADYLDDSLKTTQHSTVVARPPGDAPAFGPVAPTRIEINLPIPPAFQPNPEPLDTETSDADALNGGSLNLGMIVGPATQVNSPDMAKYGADIVKQQQSSYETISTEEVAELTNRTREHEAELASSNAAGKLAVDLTDVAEQGGVSAVDTAKSANAQGLQTTENLLLSEANGATSGMIAKFDDTKARQGELDRAVLEHLRANVVEEVALKDEVKRITELAAKHLEDNLPMVDEYIQEIDELVNITMKKVARFHAESIQRRADALVPIENQMEILLAKVKTKADSIADEISGRLSYTLSHYTESFRSLAHKANLFRVSVPTVWKGPNLALAMPVLDNVLKRNGNSGHTSVQATSSTEWEVREKASAQNDELRQLLSRFLPDGKLTGDSDVEQAIDPQRFGGVLADLPEENVTAPAGTTWTLARLGQEQRNTAAKAAQVRAAMRRSIDKFIPKVAQTLAALRIQQQASTAETREGLTEASAQLKQAQTAASAVDPAARKFRNSVQDHEGIAKVRVAKVEYFAEDAETRAKENLTVMKEAAQEYAASFANTAARSVAAAEDGFAAILQLFSPKGTASTAAVGYKTLKGSGRGIPECSDVSEARVATCCRETAAEGWTRCGQAWARRDFDGNCSAYRSYASAESFCAEMDGRLCTLAELQADRCGAGGECQYDFELVWSSSTCPRKTMLETLNDARAAAAENLDERSLNWTVGTRKFDRTVKDLSDEISKYVEGHAKLNGLFRKGKRRIANAKKYLEDAEAARARGEKTMVQKKTMSLTNVKGRVKAALNVLQKLSRTLISKRDEDYSRSMQKDRGEVMKLRAQWGQSNKELHRALDEIAKDMKKVRGTIETSEKEEEMEEKFHTELGSAVRVKIGELAAAHNVMLAETRKTLSTGLSAHRSGDADFLEGLKASTAEKVDEVQTQAHNDLAEAMQTLKDLVVEAYRRKQNRASSGSVSVGEMGQTAKSTGEVIIWRDDDVAARAKEAINKMSLAIAGTDKHVDSTEDKSASMGARIQSKAETAAKAKVAAYLRALGIINYEATQGMNVIEEHFSSEDTEEQGGLDKIAESIQTSGDKVKTDGAAAAENVKAGAADIQQAGEDIRKEVAATEGSEGGTSAVVANDVDGEQVELEDTNKGDRQVLSGVESGIADAERTADANADALLDNVNDDVRVIEESQANAMESVFRNLERGETDLTEGREGFMNASRRLLALADDLRVSNAGLQSNVSKVVAQMGRLDRKQNRTILGNVAAIERFIKAFRAHTKDALDPAQTNLRETRAKIDRELDKEELAVTAFAHDVASLMQSDEFQTLRALEKAEEDAKRVAGDQKSLVDYLERRQRTSLPWMRRTLEALGWLVDDKKAQDAAIAAEKAALEARQEQGVNASLARVEGLAANASNPNTAALADFKVNAEATFAGYAAAPNFGAARQAQMDEQMKEQADEGNAEGNAAREAAENAQKLSESGEAADLEQQMDRNLGQLEKVARAQQERSRKKGQKELQSIVYSEEEGDGSGSSFIEQRASAVSGDYCSCRVVEPPRTNPGSLLPGESCRCEDGTSGVVSGVGCACTRVTPRHPGEPCCAAAETPTSRAGRLDFLRELVAGTERAESRQLALLEQHANLSALIEDAHQTLLRPTVAASDS